MTTTSILVGLGGGGFKVSNSLRFRAAASAYLNRTPSAASNRTTWTWSGWVKRGVIPTGSSAAGSALFGAGVLGNNANFFGYLFDAATGSNTACIYLQETISNVSNQLIWLSTPIFRDPSAWYHIVIAMDTTQATAANRVKVYVNGAAVSGSFNVTPAQNQATSINNTVPQYVGASPINTASLNYLDGYIAEVNFVDGQQLTASSFGTYDANGVWQPINYSGTYGTNGFHLTFGNTSSVANLGLDSSGNGNTWTVNNVSLTAGTTYDSMTDSPTVSSSTVANYAVLNPLWQGRTNSPTNGNLDYAASSIGIGTIGMSSGSYYWEITSTGGTTTAALYSATASSSIGVTTGLTYGFRFNATTGVFDYTTNGSSFTSIATGLTTGPYFPYVSTAAATTASFNAGQRPFTYTPPTGFNALNTYNLPTPTIPNGALYMAASTYTGTGATQTINDGTNNSINATFQPDFVWIKSRSSTTSNLLYDVIRGTTNYIQTNATTANTANANTLTAFGSTGFTLGSDASAIGVNVSAATYVAWQWKGGGTGVSNTAGSITSTVSANTAAGFSVVGFTSTQSNSTIGHGLGVAPSMIIFKDYASGTTNWPVYHVSLGATQYLFLNSTSAAATDSTMFNNTAPTSTVFSTGTNSNFAPGTTIAYCFAAVPGYSSFGSFVGNGSADGPFIYTGFLPRWIMIHVATGVASNWSINDSSQVTYNVNNQTLLAENSGAVSTVYPIDFLSNGFKLRTTNQNNSGSTTIYAAFAENPFNSSRAR